MPPRKIDDGECTVNPTLGGGVEIRTKRRFCYLPPGRVADDFWLMLDHLGNVEAAYDFVTNASSDTNT